MTKLSDKIAAAAGGGGLTPVFKSASYTAAANDLVCCLTLTAAATIPITLPAGGDTDHIAICDFEDSAGDYNITITPNGAETIDGAASFTINVSGGQVDLVYQASDTDWKVAYSTPGVSGFLTEAQVDARVVAVASGLRNKWIPIDEMWDVASNPSPPGALTTYQGSAFQKLVRYRSFSGSTLNGTHVNIRLPKSWNPALGIAVRVHWVASTTATGEVQWKANVGYTGDDDDARAAYVTTITCYDTANGTQYDKHISAISAFNASGSPTKSQDLQLLIWRDGSADANNDAQWLEGITLFYYTDAPTDD